MKYKSVRSSNVVAVAHDARSLTLGVIFKSGGTYHYHEVPRKHYLAMTSRTIGSVGRYFHDHVRGKYEYTLAGAEPVKKPESGLRRGDGCPRCGKKYEQIDGAMRCRGCGYAPEVDVMITPRGQAGTGQVLSNIKEDFGHSGMADGGALRDLFERALTGGGPR
jgi:hypothetical protein